MRSNRGGIDSGERLYRLESHFEKGFVKGEKGGSMWAKSQVMRLNISEGVGHLKWEGRIGRGGLERGWIQRFKELVGHS